MVIYNWGQKSRIYVLSSTFPFPLSPQNVLLGTKQGRKIIPDFTSLFCFLHLLRNLITLWCCRIHWIYNVGSGTRTWHCYLGVMEFKPDSYQRIRNNINMQIQTSVRRVNLRSSSKYVSLPSAPGTEQIRRVLRNVVHLFTRLRWPPMSFWSRQHVHLAIKWPAFTSGLFMILDLCDQTASHPAELSNAGVGGLSKSLRFNRRLTEEEKHFVVIGVFTLWDPKRTNKLWFWKT